MNEFEYRLYLKTPAWKSKAKQRAAIDGYQCQLCGSRENLQIHHLTYRHIGFENPWVDLVTLCENCHSGVHRMMSRRTAPDRRGWKDELKISEIRAGGVT